MGTHKKRNSKARKLAPRKARKGRDRPGVSPGERKVYGYLAPEAEIRENPQPGAVCLQALTASWKSEPLFEHVRKIEALLADRSGRSELAALVISHPAEKDPLVCIRGSVFDVLIRDWRLAKGYKA